VAEIGTEPVASGAILAGIGGVAYEWTIADDRLHWDQHAATVLGVPAERIATGGGFAALLDPASTRTRHGVVLNSGAPADEAGVPYEVQYTLLPQGEGRRKKRLIVEDAGRWFADSAGRPARARGVVRIINERAEREERRAFLSRYDELTGFLNRSELLAALGEALEGAKRARGSLCFLIVAIDNFRGINEAYDFETADEVFAAVSRRIRAEVRDGDVVGRYSGTKLGIALIDCDDADMHAAAERFHAAVRREMIATANSAVAVTVSIAGVSLPRHARSVREAMARAQEALHQARKLGSDRFVAYAPSPFRDAVQRSNGALSSELVAALTQRRLKLCFQPVVDIGTRRPVFHEGLLRLERPDGSYLLANDFIGISERLGLIRPMDHYVLARALETLEEAPDARISVNVSAETVGDAEWLSLAAAAVARRPDIGPRLIVEITETAVIRSLDEAAQFVATLHDLGCPLAIDDFGAGFSSFRHLRSLGVNLVKIAGIFLKDLPRSPDDQAFVKALVALARTFDMRIVGEWVENEETARLLAGFGIDMIQGHLVGGATAEPPWRTAPSPAMREAG
jgi:diguanylate cyclase (GGDEF)-like protein